MNYMEVLEAEDNVLSKVLDSQRLLRNAVKEKSWQHLMDMISAINLLMDEFNELDEKRAEIAISVNEDSSDVRQKLSVVRGKLVRCRAENKALSDYINISRMFIQGVIEKALPQTRSKVYSRNGSIVQNKPQSVLVDTLF